MNISSNKKSLTQYGINDYYNETNKQFTPYLWTSAYGLLALIQTHPPKPIIQKYIRTVHTKLGTYNSINLSTKIKSNLLWYNNLDLEKQILISDSIKSLRNIKGGLRIGKAEQGLEPGIYLHYITKWVYALVVASHYLNNDKYLYLASQLMLTICEKNIAIRTDGSTYYPRKMEVYLEKPIQTSEIGHDPLDVYITLKTLLINLKSKPQTKTTKLYIKLLNIPLKVVMSDIHEYIRNPSKLNTSDPLGIGFLCVSCLKLRLIIFYDKVKNPFHESLYKNILIITRNSMSHIKFNKNTINSDGYRWFGTCIGLEAIQRLHNNYINKIFKDDYFSIVKIIRSQYYYLKNNILTNFNTYSYNKSNWHDHKDINITMFLNTQYPIFSIL